MEYGQIIRETRERLGIYQRDLANDNLSRNLISNIEMGRVNLMPAKGMALFTRLLEIAWEKEIYCDIRFDDLLSEKEEYFHYLKANELCKQLHDMTISKEVNRDIVDEAVDFARKHDVGLLRYYIYLYSARILTNITSKEIVCKLYFDALDYLKWKKHEEIYQLYEVGLREAVKTAYACGEFKALCHYFEMLIEMNNSKGIKSKPEVIYNLSLFYTEAEDFEKAHEYVKNYLDLNLSKSDLYDGKILECIVLTSLKFVEEGFNKYKLVLDELSHTSDYFRISLCLGNIIYVIKQNKLVDKKNVLIKYLGQLKNLINNNQDKVYDYGVLLSNLAQGYAFIGDHKEALALFKEALKVAKMKQKWHDSVVVLDESFETFYQCDEMDYYFREITLINLSLVPELKREQFLILLLKVQCSCRDGIKSINNADLLCEFIKSNII